MYNVQALYKNSRYGIQTILQMAFDHMLRHIIKYYRPLRMGDQKLKFPVLVIYNRYLIDNKINIP